MHSYTVSQLTLLDDINKLKVSNNFHIYSAYSFTNEIVIKLFENHIKPLIDKKFVKLHYVETKDHYTDLRKPIIDNIINDIKKTRIAIVDLTDHKNNVYFEAGIATTNYIPIIYTCHINDFDQIAFDVDVNQVLSWNESNIEEFLNKLEVGMVSCL